jgi:hypothetical protein
MEEELMKTASSLRLAWAMLAPLLLGCPSGSDGGSGGTLDGTAGDGGCVEPLQVDVLPSNPNFKGVTSGLAAAPSAPWQSIARGHVDDDASSMSCCEDYVLGSDASSTLTVVFGAAASGFVVFDDQPNVELDAGGNVADVAFSDLDGDGRNDLIALLPDGVLTVRFGTDASPYFENNFTMFSTEFGNDAVGRDQIVVMDINCDGALDILLPSDDGVVVMLNDGSGQLSPASSVPSSVALGWVAAGDLDHDDDADVVASASDGTVQVWIGDCGIFDAPAIHGNPQPPGTYEDTRVALAVVCPSFASLGIVFGYGDTVDVYCGNGSGDFSNVQEAHGEETSTGADFQWQPTPAYASPGYADLAAAGSGNQQVLGLDIKDNMIVALVPSICKHRSDAYSITMPYPTYLPSPLSRLVATPNPSAWGSWERLSMVGGAGLQVIR